MRTARWWRPVLLLAGVGVAAYSLQGHLPSPSALWQALRGSAPVWLLTAAALSALSMAAFAEQQRHLLAAFGVRIPAARSLALSYARSAMATALPAGSAISAGYAFKQYRARGAPQGVAAAVTVLSAVASTVGLALLYLLILADPPAWTLWLAGGVVLVAGLSVPRVRAATDINATGWRRTLALAATVPARRWLTVLGIAAVNWLTDLACLLAAIHAANLAVPVQTTATAYLLAQLIRQIPLTPGGIGVIEASLVVALTTAGAPPAQAAAAVLSYRVLSCWSILPIGLACWNSLKPRLTPA
jgi:uncharacterized membrane protein YbhN (UPF0104 family)